MEPLDLKTCMDQPPAPVACVWPGFPLGAIGALVGPAGVGKSMLALEAAIAVAAGLPEADLPEFAPRVKGKVTYLAAEDNADVLSRRVFRVCQQVDSHQAIRAVIEKLAIIPMPTSPFSLLEETELSRIIDLCDNACLVVLDTLPGFHHLDYADGDYLNQVSRVLKYIAGHTGASILCLQREPLSDATRILREAATWSASMTAMSESESARLSDLGHPDPDLQRDFVRLDIAGNSFMAAPPTRWYRRNEHGVLRPAQLGWKR